MLGYWEVIVKFGRYEWVIIFYKVIYYIESILKILMIEFFNERVVRLWNDSI